jgi:hypothetical protein
MADNVLIPLPGFELPIDFPWRVGFVSLVDETLRRLRSSGHFLPPRFFGYYFRANTPVGVGGRWTVSLDMTDSASRLARRVEELTGGGYSIRAPDPDAAPDFLLIHDRRDGACWLWSFPDGLRFVESVEPIMGGGDWCDESDAPRLLGP